MSIGKKVGMCEHGLILCYFGKNKHWEKRRNICIQWGDFSEFAGPKLFLTQVYLAYISSKICQFINLQSFIDCILTGTMPLAQDLDL